MNTKVGYWGKLYNILFLRFHYVRKQPSVLEIVGIEDYVRKVLWIFQLFNFVKWFERVKCHRERHHWIEKDVFEMIFQKWVLLKGICEVFRAMFSLRELSRATGESEKSPWCPWSQTLWFIQLGEIEMKKPQFWHPRTHWSNWREDI